MPNQIILPDKKVIKVLDSSKLEAYKESIKPYNKRARKALGQFSSKNGELAGSSPLMIIQYINAGLLPQGTRLARREELEYAISQDDSFLRENYADFGIALRSAGDSY